MEPTTILVFLGSMVLSLKLINLNSGRVAAHFFFYKREKEKNTASMLFDLRRSVDGRT